MSSQSVPLTRKQLRQIVTEEALQVSPELLGLPLAAPWRRGLAIALDGLLVALLTSTPKVLFGIAAAYVLLRASARKTPGGGYVRRSFRFMMRIGAAMFLFFVAVSLWDTVRDRIRGRDRESPVQASITASGSDSESDSIQVSGLEAVRFATEVMALLRADNEAEAHDAAEELLTGMKATGMTDEAARGGLRDMVKDAQEKPWLARAVEDVIAADEQAAGVAPVEPVAVQTPGEDSLVSAYAAALENGDSATADSLRPVLAGVLSADTIGALDRRYESLESNRNELQTALQALEEREEEGPGLLALIRRFLDDLGLGLGWSGLYFTATTALWQGRTPGKRLFGIRVIRLTGKPIGWWASFERFGGYAAGFATGLLGFLQIFWDDNRQAIHDKIAVTAVVRDDPARLPPPVRREA